MWIPLALILRDRRHSVRTTELHRAIVSKDGGVLTELSTLPGKRQAPPLEEEVAGRRNSGQIRLTGP